jgi:hypothetical protein
LTPRPGVSRVKHTAMPLQAHPTDARVKCLTHWRKSSNWRTLQPHQPLQHALGEAICGCGEPPALPEPALTSALSPLQTTSPACPSEADLHQQVVSLQAQVMLQQQQLAHLTSMLFLGPQTSADHPRASLAALVPPAGPLRPGSPALPQQEGHAQAETGPRPHPAERRRRRLLPLIEFSTTTNRIWA